ncbi:hypothetical protein I4F81_009043 [Pyropia yezoensis]|uniref:Uncharacterized protein n=1 Tax=Pyropia yezoensis TaxID=2788 RepID=A0ACC3C8L3_PYRYE|nr:hypothetical protein I4F81_009043 [Neopyropia yezoensis]
MALDRPAFVPAVAAATAAADVGRSAFAPARPTRRPRHATRVGAPAAAAPPARMALAVARPAATPSPTPSSGGAPPLPPTPAAASVVIDVPVAPTGPTPCPRGFPNGSAGAGAYRLDATEEGLPLTYDIAAIERYWKARPAELRARTWRVMRLAGPFIAALTLDMKTGAIAGKGRARAAELRELLTALGASWIKLGQALSVRPDLIGPGAMEELQQLCDAVPCFSSDVARKMIEEELGLPVDEVFSSLSEEPIAAASLGQVYRGVLRGSGERVAVKVQRPDMLRNVSLDLYLMRRLLSGVQKVQNRFTSVKSDLVGLLDEWAGGMYKELDYVNEANNSRRFYDLVAPRLGSDNLVVPAVYLGWTSRKVLVMEWIDGKKLAEAEPDEVKELLTLGVECFLIQLLQTGFMHADPHPGNLFLTSTGKLAVLDFGLMSSISESYRNSCVSAIIHLANRDYEKVVQDFIDLDFLSPDTDRVKVQAVLGAILDQALTGGGAKSINFASLSDELAAVTFDFEFSVPPSFALILRALSVLEGIALTGDPNYKLVMSSFPFISRHILTSDSPALRTTLREVLYRDGAFSPVRLSVLINSAQGFLGDTDAFVDFDTPPADGSSAADAVAFLASDQGALIRELLSDELASGLDVLVRHNYARLLSAVDNAFSPPRLLAAPLAPLRALAGLAAALPPLPLPGGLALRPASPLLPFVPRLGFLDERQAGAAVRPGAPSPVLPSWTSAVGGAVTAVPAATGSVPAVAATPAWAAPVTAPRRGALSAFLPPVTVEEQRYLRNLADILAYFSSQTSGGGAGSDALRVLLPEVVPKLGGVARHVVGRLGEKATARLFAEIIGAPPTSVAPAVVPVNGAGVVVDV